MNYNWVVIAVISATIGACAPTSSIPSTTQTQRVMRMTTGSDTLLRYHYSNFGSSDGGRARDLARIDCSGGQLLVESDRVVGSNRNEITYVCRNSSPTLTSSLSLEDLVSRQCNARGWNQGSPSFGRCQQEMRISYAAAGLREDAPRANRMVQVSEQAAQRCGSAGLRRGTTEFASCSIQAQANIGLEVDRNQQASRQAAAAEAGRDDLQRALEMARADAERARRDAQSARLVELGLGMAAGRTSRPASSDGTRTYNVNGRTFTCTTTGSITNCL